MEINTLWKKAGYLELSAQQIQPDAVYSRPDDDHSGIGTYRHRCENPDMILSMSHGKGIHRIEIVATYSIHRRAIFSGIEQFASLTIRRRGLTALALYSMYLKPGSRDQL